MAIDRSVKGSSSASVKVCAKQAPPMARSEATSSAWEVSGSAETSSERKRVQPSDAAGPLETGSVERCQPVAAPATGTLPAGAAE
jgi:hypothetical protein